MKSRSKLPPSGSFLPHRYALLRELGEGGMGRVYLARDRMEDGRPVALKVCHPAIGPEHIRREFRILRELRHPGIARAHDLGRLPRGGATYFTMEYVPGWDLGRHAARLRRRRDGLRSLTALFVRVAEVLAYLHSKGLLHLDLKPSNIIVGRSGGDRVKLIDFGLFQNLAFRDLPRDRGTLHYMAPEMFAGKPVDERTDLYALGVTLYRCFTGRFPVGGRSAAEIIRNCGRQPPRRTRRLPEPLERVVMKLLAKSPQRRFQKALEVAAALRAATPGADGESSPRPGSPAGNGVVEAPGFEGEDLDFAGRERELDAAFAWIEALSGAAAPPHPVLLIEGGIGAGKTRLLEAAFTELLVRMVPTIELHSYPLPEGGGGLRRLVEKLMAVRPLDAKALRGGHFRFLLAQLGILPADDLHRRETAALLKEEIRERVVRDALELISDAFPEGPLVLGIDDLHRADADLLALVRAIAAGARPVGGGPFVWSNGAQDAGPRLGVLATVRSESEFFGRAFPEGPPAGARRVRLPELTTSSALAALARFEPVLGRPAARDIARKSRGNPFLLCRLLRSALRGEPAPDLIHDDLARILLERFEGWRGAGRSALEALALLGGRAAAADLRWIVRLKRPEVEEVRAALVRDGLVREDGRNLVLAHDGLKDRILAGIPEKRRRAAHLRIGRRLVKDRRRLAESASHLLAGGLTAAAFLTVEKAITHLSSSGRHEAALPLALKALERLPEGPARRRLQEVAGDLSNRCGEFDRAAERYGSLAESPGLHAKDRPRLLRKRGGILQRVGDNAAAERALEEALRLLDASDDTEEQLQVLNEFASLKLFQRDFAAATTFANRGLEILERPPLRALPRGTRAAQALGLHSVAGHIALRQFEYERAIEALERALELSRTRGSQGNVALILNNLGIAYSQSNRLHRALRVYREAAELARRVGDVNVLFSILCNVVGIRARMGQLGAARALVEQARSMPLAARSRRARLFLLHSEALIARLALLDARPLWEECVAIAEGIPDPLFARYGRVHLLENEIAVGRWRRARAILGELERIEDSDFRFMRAVASRGAFLDALAGRPADARARLRRAGEDPSGPVRYSDQWDALFAAAARLELGDLEAAESVLDRQRVIFERSAQPPGALECSLLLVECALRRRDGDAARRRILEARALLSRHDDPVGSRGAPARLPFLEARLGLLVPRSRRLQVVDRLADAAGNLPPGAPGEMGFLVRLVEAGAGGAGTAAVARARARFLAGLDPADRRSYSVRDHRARLGLPEPEGARPPPPAAVAGLEGRPDESKVREDRYRALLELAAGPPPSRALEILRAAAGARAGAILVDGEPPVFQGFPARERPKVLARLRGTLQGGPHGAAAGDRAPGEHGAAADRPPDAPPEEGVALAPIVLKGRARGAILLDGASRLNEPSGTGDFLRLAGGVWAGARAPGSASRATALHQAGNGGTPAETRTLAVPRIVFGTTPAMRELETIIHRTRESELPVLLTGESGTGKELLAQAIHSLGPRRDGPFLAQSCAAIPEGLLEADLFGYRQGAFSGADRSRTGFLFAAEGGTFFLDAVESLSPAMQVKLVRILAEKEVRPLGGERTRRIDVRFIASSQRDLKDAVDRGEFRRDLYFRLAGICLRVPPLRERSDDIPLFMERFLLDEPGGGFTLTPSALRVLKSHPWPGNVRELESVIRRLSFYGLRVVGAGEVTRVLGMERASPLFPRWIFEGKGYNEVVAKIKREYLIHLHQRHAGDLDRVARELGTSKRNLYLRLKSLGIRPEDLRVET